MSKLPAIKSCPFCGREPFIEGSGEGQRGLMIHCLTDGCVNPHVSYYDHASAVRAWNRRALTSAKQEAGTQ